MDIVRPRLIRYSQRSCALRNSVVSSHRHRGGGLIYTATEDVALSALPLTSPSRHARFKNASHAVPEIDVHVWTASTLGCSCVESADQQRIDQTHCLDLTRITNQCHTRLERRSTAGCERHERVETFQPSLKHRRSFRRAKKSPGKPGLFSV